MSEIFGEGLDEGDDVEREVGVCELEHVSFDDPKVPGGIAVR